MGVVGVSSTGSSSGSTSRPSVKELGRRWTNRLKVPGFIELSMVTAFHKARFEVEVEHVVISGSEAKENAGEVIAIKFAASVTATFDTHP